MVAKVNLKIISGPQKGSVLEFDEHDTFIFGRMNDCHINIPDDGFLSRHHFILEVNPPDARMRDLGSLNGTFVNGRKIGGRRKDETPEQGALRNFAQVDLNDGDEIRTGDTCFLVEKICQKNTITTLRCQQCGKDVSKEIGSDRPGSYLCAECEAKIAVDPQAFLSELSNATHQSGNPVELPDYEFLQLLGKGGMGQVFLVRNKINGEKLALKTMLSKIAANPDAVDKFLREIRTNAALEHPNIVNQFDAGANGSIFYIVMEYCNYGNLLDYVEDLHRPLSLKETIPLLVHTLEGLSHAHTKGFVHRDLKPQNILLCRTQDGLVAKVGDFGLSKSFIQAGFSGMTVTGSYAGSFPFMPREQVTNFKYIKPTSDIWSLAATFYFALTGLLPRDFQEGEDPMLAILQGNIIPLRYRRPDLPLALCSVFDRALSNEPNDRYQTAEDMKTDLMKNV